MQINKMQPIAKTMPVGAEASSSASSQPAQDTQPVSRRSDAVQLSEAGLALSSAAPESSTAASALDPQRAAEIRSKIVSGAYNSLAMADQVARSIIRSGDL